MFWTVIGHPVFWVVCGIVLLWTWVAAGAAFSQTWNEMVKNEMKLPIALGWLLFILIVFFLIVMIATAFERTFVRAVNGPIQAYRAGKPVYMQVVRGSSKSKVDHDVE